MLIRYLIVFMFLSFLSCNSNQPDSNIVNNADSLTPFSVQYITGDEVYELYEMRIYKQGDKFFAEDILPSYNRIKKLDTITIELTKDRIEACDSFLLKAKSMPSKCESFSSSIQNYTIILPNDTIIVTGDCDWGRHEFFDLRGRLFSERFQEMYYLEIAQTTEKIMDLVAEQNIVKDKMKLIDSLSNSLRHISLIPVLHDTASNIYLVKVGEDNGTNFVIYYNFLVNANSMSIINKDGKLEGQ